MDFVPSDFGAGVVIDREGRIVTAYHVLGDVLATDYFVWSNRRPFPARVLAADPWFDLAVLKVDALNGDALNGNALNGNALNGGTAGFEPIQLADARTVRKGQFVVALGNPQAIARDGRPSAAWGLVSNLLRRAPRVADRGAETAARDAALHDTVHHHGTMIQTDARLDVGYSGGALLNLSGEMIGLLTSYTGGPGQTNAAGLAIPVDEHFRAVLSRLKEGKAPEFGFLGVGPPSFDASVRGHNRHGVLVETVLASSPAARAGLRPADVITHVDDEPLHDDNDLFRMIGSRTPGRVVRLTVFRGDVNRNLGQTMQRESRLDKKHVASRRPLYATVLPPSWRGLRVDYASVAMHENLAAAQFLPLEGCLVVVNVERDSPAWQAGIRPGLFIERVGEQRVTNPAEFFQAVGDQLNLVSLRVIAANGTAAVQDVSP
jgi:serine protease Do